jgi:hypothetical protein
MSESKLSISPEYFTENVARDDIEQATAAKLQINVGRNTVTRVFDDIANQMRLCSGVSRSAKRIGVPNKQQTFGAMGNCHEFVRGICCKLNGC